MHRIGADWSKTSWGPLMILVLALCGTAFSQERAAEGQYQMSGTAKAATRWVLYSKSSGGYHLESEIQNDGNGLRIVQVEELNAEIVPAAIGYEFYPKDQKKPSATMTCEFSGDSIICRSQPGATSKPFKYRGPFWLWPEGLFAVDLPWLLDGAVNMARLEKGKTSVATITVSGGSQEEWVFSAEEEGMLEFAGVESMEIGGTRVAVRHYSLRSGEETLNLWIAGSGILVKMSRGEGDEFVLTNYRQYKKLIPELKVESQGAAQTAS